MYENKKLFNYTVLMQEYNEQYLLGHVFRGISIGPASSGHLQMLLKK